MSNEESSSGDDEGDEASEVKILPKRSTRGVRVSDLHREGDDDFWAQDFWQEVESDTEYESESASEDLLDADFYDTEDESDDEEVVVAKEKNKRKNVYVDKNKHPKKAKTTAQAKGKKEPVSAVYDKSPRKLRKSTRTVTQERAAARQKQKARGASKGASRARPAHKAWTQEERLKEAEVTEVINRKSLEDLLRIEDLNKKKAMPSREIMRGPGVITSSHGGRTLVTFTRLPTGSMWPAVLTQGATSCPQPDFCLLTKLPAKYKDPHTGLPFATVQAFKTIQAVQKQLAKDGAHANLDALISEGDSGMQAPGLMSQTPPLHVMPPFNPHAPQQPQQQLHVPQYFPQQPALGAAPFQANQFMGTGGAPIMPQFTPQY